MMLWLTIALRNTWKNRRRSAYTVLAIALGYAGVNMFGGFKDYLDATMKNAFVHSAALGHLTVFKHGYNAEGRREPTKFLITATELEKIKSIVHARPDVVVATPQLQIQGLVSNGQISTIFVALARVPSDYSSIRKRAGGWMAETKHYDGEPLRDDLMHGIALSRGLAEVLGLKYGGNAIVMSPTVAGNINALDGEYIARFDATVDALNDKLMEVPLSFAQELYNTDSIDRVVILFDDDQDLAAKQAWLRESLASAGLDMEVMNWRERAPFFVAVQRMNNMIFLVMFLIVFIIVVMSIINTIGMTILERTREIGTLRALGLKRRGITRLFALESLMLGILGSIAGLVLFMLGWVLVLWLDPHWMPPTYSHPIPLQIYLVPSYLLWSAVFLCGLSLLSAILPARRAAHMEVVDALGHV